MTYSVIPISFHLGATSQDKNFYPVVAIQRTMCVDNDSPFYLVPCEPYMEYLPVSESEFTDMEITNIEHIYFVSEQKWMKLYNSLFL